MMVRNARSKGVFSAPFGFCFFICIVAPTQIGYQDVASLIARQPAVAAHWGQHIRASAFGTIHAATFSFSRPIGTAAPQPLSFQLASLDPYLITLPPWDAPPVGIDDPPLPFPKVDRSAKGDRQPVLHPPERKPETAKAPAESDVPAAALDTETKEPVEAVENSTDDVPDPVEGVVAASPDLTPPEPVAPLIEIARRYPGYQVPGDAAANMEKWTQGGEAAAVGPADPDIKLSALDPAQATPEDKGGETIAPKGEVTGEGKRPLTPAERLKLEGKSRSVAEKCLADAIYFESRGEPVRGQIAVAQVVMNRVFSGYYPRSVCGTVYQNKHRRLACQFTFACDGIPDVVTEPVAWLRATRIARDVLDGKYWLPEVDRATHYHAYWVRPSWVREMKRLYKFGVHTFYRPRAWGDGADTPSWGSAAATNEAIAKL